MSFFSKKPSKSKKSKARSDSPKVAKKLSSSPKESPKTKVKNEDRRTKSQPSASSLGVKSFSKTKSHDPDIFVGSAKLSKKSMSGASDEEFFDARLSEDEFYDAPVELPKLARQASGLAPPQGRFHKVFFKHVLCMKLR